MRVRPNAASRSACAPRARVHDVGPDRAGEQRADAHVGAGELGAEGLGERPHGALGQGVRGVLRDAGEGRHARDVHDVGLVGLSEQRQEVVASVEDAEDVDADDPPEVVDGLLGELADASAPRRCSRGCGRPRGASSTSSGSSAMRSASRRRRRGSSPWLRVPRWPALVVASPSASTSTSARAHPRRASSRAVARPMPLPAPVITATRPVRLLHRRYLAVLFALGLTLLACSRRARGTRHGGSSGVGWTPQMSSEVVWFSASAVPPSGGELRSWVSHVAALVGVHDLLQLVCTPRPATVPGRRTRWRAAGR